MLVIFGENMNSQLSGVISSIITLIAALLGFGVSFLIKKNRQKQSRIDSILENNESLWRGFGIYL